MKRIEPILVALFFVLVAGLTVFGFTARHWLVPSASEHGPGVDRMIRYLLVTTGVIFVLGHAVLAAFVWRYSGDGATGARVRTRTELLWALIPVITLTIVAEVGVLLIGMPVWNKVYGQTPPEAIQVEVVAKQFEWLVRYPGKDGVFGSTRPELVDDMDNPLGLDEKDAAAADDVVTRGQLYLPENRAARVRLRSHDFLHSFSIPEFRIKQDVIPGVAQFTQFVPVKAGDFEIACAELCGLGHYRMRGSVRVLTPSGFDQWRAVQHGWFE